MTSPRTLAAALVTLDAHADHANALQARLIAARRLLLLGRLDQAGAMLAQCTAQRVPPALTAMAELTAAELALRAMCIGPVSGTVVASIPAPGHGCDSGLTWAGGSLWVGQYRDRKIHQIDPATGDIIRTIESNRFLTGVTWSRANCGTVRGRATRANCPTV